MIIKVICNLLVYDDTFTFPTRSMTLPDTIRAFFPAVWNSFSAIELVKDKETKEPLVEYNKDPENILGGIIGVLKKKGFSTYSHENNIIVAPPLIITETELRDAKAIMDEVLADVDAMI